MNIEIFEYIYRYVYIIKYLWISTGMATKENKTTTGKVSKPLKALIIIMISLYVAFVILASYMGVDKNFSIGIAASIAAVLVVVFVAAVIQKRRNQKKLQE